MLTLRIHIPASCLRRRVLFRLLCIAGALPAGNPEAAAQHDSIRPLSPVHVISSMAPHVRTLTPSQTISRADFRKYGAYNVADAVRNFSGVNIRDYGGMGGMKTVSVRSLGAGHTAVQYDGLPVSDAQNGQLDLGKIDLSNVSHITLHIGQPDEIDLPASSFAAGSLLLVNSLPSRIDSLTKNRVGLSFSTGSFGLVNPSARLEQTLGRSWMLLLSSNFQRAHGRYRYKVEGDGSDSLVQRLNAGVSNVRNDLTLLWQKNTQQRFYIRSNYYHSDRGLPGAVVFYNPNSRQHLRNDDLFIQSGYKQETGSLRLRAGAKFSRERLRYTDPDFLNSTGGLDQRYRQDTWYGTATVACRVLPPLDISYASDLTLSTLEANFEGVAYPRRVTYLHAFSGRVKYSRLEVSGTLLNTILRERVGAGTPAGGRSVWSPALMAALRPFNSPDITVRMFYKHIFRNPTFNDLYYTRGGNRNLRPEFATQYNLGVTLSKTPGRGIHFLTFTADAYYNRVRDKIVAIPARDLFTWSMLNLGKIEILGADLGLKTALKTGAFKNTWSLNYTYQSAIDVTNSGSRVYLHQIPYTPRHNLHLHTGLDHGRWGIFLNQGYTSRRYSLPENIPANSVRGFSVLDISGLCRFRTGPWMSTLSVELNNLLNTRYYLIASYPMPGRSCRLSIQFSI